MLIAPFRASSCGPIFQYRLFYLLKFILSKNFEIIRCYSEVMTSPFYIVKLESFTLKVCQLELKKGCQPKLLFERFRAISNIVRRSPANQKRGSTAHFHQAAITHLNIRSQQHSKTEDGTRRVKARVD